MTQLRMQGVPLGQGSFLAEVKGRGGWGGGGSPTEYYSKNQRKLTKKEKLGGKYVQEIRCSPPKRRRWMKRKDGPPVNNLAQGSQGDFKGKEGDRKRLMKKKNHRSR